MADLPTVRWGIVATGTISDWFVSDIVRSSWPNKRANHTIAAIGSSSLQKGKDFAARWIPSTAPQPQIYASYSAVYTDSNVDCVYIGTPHSFHAQQCLDAIAAGKNVLCEKPFTMTAAESRAVLAAAKEANVFIMEAVWTRFFPLVRELQTLLYPADGSEGIIGAVQRVFCDFPLHVGDIDKLPAASRYRDPALGAGSLLDLGIYSLTWGLLALDPGVGETAQTPVVQSVQSLRSGVDVATAMLLWYPETGRQGILSSTTNVPGGREVARIEGSKGIVFVEGETPSHPNSFMVRAHGEGKALSGERGNNGEEKKWEFENPGRGYYWMADAVAVDLSKGRKENALMPWQESLRIMELFDGVRKRGGAKFPVDDW